jgi:hypothetical protein
VKYYNLQGVHVGARFTRARQGFTRTNMVSPVPVYRKRDLPVWQGAREKRINALITNRCERAKRSLTYWFIRLFNKFRIFAV